MKLLIVDDSRAMRMIIRRSLRQAGFGHHDIIEAADGSEGLKEAIDATPDVVIADWNMPRMTGMELLQALKKASFPGVFGFITSESTDGMRHQAMAAGAQFFVTKPFTAVAIERALAPFLSGESNA